VARFLVRRTPFGRPPGAGDEDDGAGLRAPARVRLAARRAAAIAEADETLAHLPGPGESLHALMTCRLDLADVIGALLHRLGRCDRLLLATLGYNGRNLRTMLAWLDGGAVGTLTLLASRFYRAHNGDQWGATLAEFRRRGQRAACADCHAKVVALHFASGERLAVEGSANLCGNGSAREQFTVINDPGLCAWHSRWIEGLVARHEGDESTSPGAG
jgi:hypothetical protein